MHNFSVVIETLQGAGAGPNCKLAQNTTESQTVSFSLSQELAAAVAQEAVGFTVRFGAAGMWEVLLDGLAGGAGGTADSFHVLFDDQLLTTRSAESSCFFGFGCCVRQRTHR